MQTTNYFNEETGIWETIKLDDFGFPLTDERKQDIIKADIEREEMALKMEEEIESIFANAEIAAGPKPVGFVVGLDIVNLTWIPLTQIPAQELLWESWIKKEDGWYPPIDYPSNNPFEYMWDELEQAWIKFVPMEV